MDLIRFVNIYFTVVFTLLGIVIGSFLNVVIYRTPAGRKFSTGRSMCMSCGHELAAKDLVPLFSWLFLRGKCRYCKAPVPSRYAKIESFTGLVFLIAALTHPECSLFLTAPDNPLLILLFVDFVLFLIACAACISAMMIWYDTNKSFLHIALFSVISSLLSTVVWDVLRGHAILSVIKRVAVNTGYIAGVVAVCFILLTVFRKKYEMKDLKLDLPFTPLLLFTFFTGITMTYITVAVFAVIYGISRVITKNTKGEKYMGIATFVLIVLITIIRYFIYN